MILDHPVPGDNAAAGQSFRTFVAVFQSRRGDFALIDDEARQELLKKIFSREFYDLFATLDDGFDSLYHVDTEGLSFHNYGASRIAVFDEIIASVPFPLEKYWFVDVGAGKGRALLLAAQQDFPKIIGLEICTDYCDAARRNVRNASQLIPGADRIEIENIDVFHWTRLKWPNHKYLFFYMYCPFSPMTANFNPAIYQLYFQLLADQGRRTGSRVILAFVNPMDAANYWEGLSQAGFSRIACNQKSLPGMLSHIFSWDLHVLNI